MKRPPAVSNSALIFLRHNQVDVFHENSQSIEDNTKSKTTRLFLVMRCDETKQKAKINLIHLNISLQLFRRLFDSASTVGVCVIGEHIQAALNISSDLYSMPMRHTPYLCLALHEYVTVIHTSLNILNTIRSQVKTIQSRSQFYFLLYSIQYLLKMFTISPNTMKFYAIELIFTSL